MVNKWLAAVYAQPDDDEARLRYADELGDDPRAELIRLQLSPISPAATKKIRALLKTHGPEWLAPLGKTLVTKSVEWERGFPVAGTLATVKPKERDAQIAVPALATLRRLDLSKPNTAPDLAWLRRFLFESPLRGLRELRGLWREILGDLLTSEPPWQLEHVSCLEWGAGGVGASPEAIAAAFGAGGGLPRLSALHLTFRPIGNDPALYDWLVSTEAGRRLRSLSMGVDADHVPSWLQAVLAWGARCNLERIEFRRVVLERSADRWRLAGSVDGAPAYVLDRLRTIDRALVDVDVRGL